LAGNGKSTARSRSSPAAQPTRAWQRMLSGRRLDLLDPSPLDIEIADIAHGLARVARWNGQTLGAHALSVAQHSLVVLEIADDLWRQSKASVRAPQRLAVLLHDAPEYVVGDLISPFKAAIGLDYKAFELRLLSAIHRRFGLPATLSDEITAHIKTADRCAAYFEATALAGFSVSEAQQFFGAPKLSAALTKKLSALEALPVGDAQTKYLAVFEEISNAMPKSGVL
jgi:uncharacterized protein